MMDDARHSGLAAAALLAGLALLHALIGGSGPWPARANWPRDLASPAQRAALEGCRQNVEWEHDVQWAAACTTQAPDDSPDCTLPDDRAAVLNASREAAEAQCFADVHMPPRFAMRHAP